MQNAIRSSFIHFQQTGKCTSPCIYPSFNTCNVIYKSLCTSNIFTPSNCSRSYGLQFALGCIHYVCYRGGRGFFFSAARFFISPPRSIQIFIIPQAISRKMNTPPPSSLTRNIKINICIIVHYICLKFQETCLIRTSREL